MLAGTYQQEMAVTSAQVDQQIGERLAAHDVRYTAGRRKVAAALLQAGGPRSASELHAELGDAVPVSSLYRSLAVMTEAGILARHPGRDGDARYELAEWLTGHHHHLVCHLGLHDHRDGDVHRLTDPVLVASNGHLHSKLLQLLDLGHALA